MSQTSATRVSGESYTWALEAEIPGLAAIGWTPAPKHLQPPAPSGPGQLLHWEGKGVPRLVAVPA